MRGVATVPRLVQAMVMEWSPESDEPWPSNDGADRRLGSEATVDELAVAVGRAREGRTPKLEAPKLAEELIFEPSF
jgi:hypothetical protein